MNTKNKTVRLLISALASLLLVAGASADSAEPAPDFTLKSTTGDNLRLSEYRGQVVMLNFWASWCGPCRQEMPLLDELHQRYSKAGFTILGVNVENNPEAAQRALQEIPVTFPILFDNDGTVSKLYDISAMPTTYLLDRDGKVRYLHKGYKPGYEIDYRRQIKELIKE